MTSDLLLSHRFVLAYCAFIVVIFLYYVVDLLRKVHPLRSKLKYCKARTDEIDGQMAFVEAFESYNLEMEGKFGTPWEEFVETLVLPFPGSANVIRNTRSASQFLNDASIIFPRISFATYRSVPNVLTGMGILGTFLGLAAGVHAASVGLTSGDSLQVTESLRQLLDGASLAFLTSLCGILFSLIFGFVERPTTRGLHAVLHDWTAAIETCLEPVTAESVALEQLDQAKRATRQLERFNTELIISLEQALDEEIAGRLSPQLDRLVEAVQGLRSDRSSDAGKMIEQVLGQFTNAMRERAGSEFEEMAVIISGLNRTLSDVTAMMAQSQQKTRIMLDEVTAAIKASMDDSTTAMTETLHRSLHDVSQEMASASTRLVERLSASSASAVADMQESIGVATDSLANTAVDAASKISATVHGLENAAESLDRSTQQSQRVLTDITAFVNQFDTLRETITTVQRRFAELTMPIVGAASAIEAATGRTSAALADTQSLVDRIEANVKALEQHQGEVSKSWIRYQERFEGIDRSLGLVFRQIDEGLSRYCEQVKEFANQLDRTTSSTIRDLAGATHELGQSIEDLTDQMGRRV